jgi:hypothetical protein
MKCNIDARGKAVRLKLGILGIFAGIILSFVLFFTNLELAWIWIFPAGAIGGGLFSVFEGWSGWCVVRAMGFKTPI